MPPANVRRLAGGPRWNLFAHSCRFVCSGPAFSEARLIGFAYAFEQATKHRVAPDSTPPLPSDTVRRK